MPVGSSSSVGALARAHRSALRDANPPRDTALWLIAMDYQNTAPLRKVRVPASLLGLSASAATASSVSEDGLVNLMSLGAAVACASPGIAETTSRLFCDLPFFLPLPSFVPGNFYIPLDASMAPLENLRPQLRLRRVESVEENSTSSGFTRRRRLHFEVTAGPSHMTLFINNRGGFSRVQTWSLGASLEDSAESGRTTLGNMYEKQGEGNPPELFVYFASGMPLDAYAALQAQEQSGFDAASLLAHAVPSASDDSFAHLPRSWSFWVEVADSIADLGEPGSELPYLDLAIAGHYLAPDLNAFVSGAIVPFLPRWITPVWFTSFHDSFRF